MPIQQNLNVSPYFADFDPAKNYYKTLFKPGYAIQARELTGIQSSIADQIEQLASKFMVPGTIVTPGEFGYANPAAYVKIRSTTTSNLQNFVGYTLTGVVSGVTAKVLHVEEATPDDAITFFVTYTSSGNTEVDAHFQEGETLTSDSIDSYSAVVGVSGVDKPIASSAMGFGSLFTVTNGSYYINGYMVRNYDQTIVVSKYTTTPTTQVGFLVTESFVTSNEDVSLLDNAQGYSNFAAPGADRLKIELNLSKLDIDSTVPNFIRLATIIQGNLQGSPSQTIKWDWLFDILARRTFNESGDYVVKDFNIQPLEYPNTQELDGLYDSILVDNVEMYPPVPGTEDVDLIPYEVADSNYVLNVSSGLAYVNGYEVGFDSSLYKFGNKSRTTGFRNNASLNITDSTYFYTSKVHGLPDIQNINSGGSAIALDNIILYRNFIDGYTGEALNQNTDIPQNIGNAPQTTYHIIFDRSVSSPYGPNTVYSGGSSVVAVGSSAAAAQRGSTNGDAKVLSVTKIPALPVGILTPKYFQPSYVIGSSEYYEYTSEYKLGINSIQYFTHLSVLSDSTDDWEVGEYIFGDDSGAYAVVETGTVRNVNGYDILVLSNVVGEFIDGEDVYQGGKVGTTFRPGEIVGFTFVDAGVPVPIYDDENEIIGYTGDVFDLSSENQVTVTVLGSSVTLTEANGDIIPSLSEIKLTKKGRDKILALTNNISSSNRRKLNYTIVTSPGEVSGYGVLPAENIKNSTATTKSFYSPLLDTNDFSADISSQTKSHLDSLVVAQGSLFTGNAQNNYLTCNNFSGDPSEELKFGDIISFVGDNGISVTKQVLFTTEPSGYGALRTPAYVYLTTTLEGSVTGKQIERIRAKKFGNASDNLIYQLPQKVIKSLETAPLSTDIRYQAFREFYVSYTSGTTTVSITTTSSTEQFIGAAQNTSITIAETTNNTNSSIEGRFIIPSNIQVQDSGKKLVFTIPAISTSGVLKIITSVAVTDAKAKKKILVKYEDSEIDSRIVISAENAAKKVISLGRADVFKLYSVVTSDGIDVTDNYIFDDGQRDNIYDISTLILKSNRPIATSGLRITCDAFDHTNDGDFFSVDSYTHEDGVAYNKIPIYAQTTAIPDQQKTTPPIFVELRDCIDFRPTVNTLPGNASQLPGISGLDAQSSTNFRDASQGGNADVPRFLVPGSILQCDIEYYLSRIDSLFLDQDGELKLISGTPDINPKAPDNLSTAIRLYDLILPPYTFSAEDIYIKKYNYRRYTMKDISDIDKRLNKVEDYVSLSLLEQSALNTTVRDAVTGLDRFKNGFVVDAFRDHANGNTISDEYRCSIDPRTDQLRAPHFTEQVELEEINQLDNQRSSNGYQKTGPLFTVPYSSVDFIKNPFATRTVNLQPFSVFVYDGEITLDPSVDTWQEVRRRDRLVIEDNTLYDAMVDMTDSMAEMGLGTVWGDWETTSSRTVSGGDISFAEAQRRGLNIQDGGGSIPFSWRPVNVSTTINTQQREEFRLSVNPNTSTTVETSQGERVVDVQVSRTMRSTAVFFTAYRLKPNTRYYAFFDGVDVNAWVSPDSPDQFPEDNSSRFVSAPNTNPKGFGENIISDDNGVITGVFLIPNGHSPVAESKFNGNVSDISYNTNSITRHFDTGTRSFRLTTNSTNGKDVDAFGESAFTSSGVIVDRQETIVSTRIPSVERISTGRIETTEVSQTASAVAYDPVAQTFLVDTNNPDGVFVTELDVYFNTKDDKESVLAYLVTTEGQVPTEQIIPFSMVEKKPDTLLRVVCQLGSLTSETIPAGTIVVGRTSGARGIVKSAVTFNDVSLGGVRNTNETVYNIILNNYTKDFITGEEIYPEVAPASNSKFTIVQDEVILDRIDIRKLGQGYGNGNVSITFSPPELPGGEVPVATATASNGKIVKINIFSFGSGYINIPTATINGNGSGAELFVRVKDSRKAVEMGVATSEDATVATKFKFQAPVYLLGNTNYAFVLKSPNSIEYKAFISKLGENIIGTSTRVVHQPLLGSIFRSQNGGLWTEDQTEDIMFTLRRAEFLTNNRAIINLENIPLGSEPMDIDPIETNSTPGTSNNFGANPRIIKVYKKTHGNLPGDNVLIEGIRGSGSPERINNIPITEINRIHTVISSDFNHFTVLVDTQATSSGKSGGNSGKCSYNRPFEVINLRSGSILLKNTSIKTNIRSSGCSGITGNGQNPYILSSPVNSASEISYYYTTPQQCAHYLNEAQYSGRDFLQGRRSLNTSFELSTSNSKISPVLDYDRTNAILVHSLINDPKASDSTNGEANITITYDGTNNLTLPKGQLLTFNGGSVLVDDWNNTTRKLRVRGADVHKITTATNLKKLNENLGANIVKISSINYPYFIPETQKNGSAFAKWISREFRLENPCDGLEIKLTGIMYENTSIKLYYRTRDEGFDGNLVDISWIPFNGTGLCNDNDQVSIRSSDIIDPRQFSGNDFTEFTWSAQNMTQFIGFSIKIVMTASNPCKLPIIDDFRAIATE